MSALSFESNFYKLKRAFKEAENPIKRPVSAAPVRELVRRSLESFHVTYNTDGNAVQYVCSNVCCVDCSGDSHRAEECARLCRAFAIFFGFKQKATIFLALQESPKILAHNRPLTMEMINSGVTYATSNMIIIWRFDHDFWKVVIHELIHLMALDTDEADTEAHALDLHCMVLSNTYEDYISLKAKQIKRSQDLAFRMKRVSAGTTNAVQYFVNAVNIWTGRDHRGCSDCRADGGADELLQVTL